MVIDWGFFYWHINHTLPDFSAAADLSCCAELTKGHPLSETIVDVDEALSHLNRVPADERGSGWQAYLNAVLDKRLNAQQELGESCPEQSKCVVNQAVLNWSQDQAAAPTTPARLGLVTPASTTEAGTLHEGQ